MRAPAGAGALLGEAEAAVPLRPIAGLLQRLASEAESPMATGREDASAAQAWPSAAPLFETVEEVAQAEESPGSGCSRQEPAAAAVAAPQALLALAP